MGFRYFVLSEARALGILGFTRNLPDGNVEVQAAGELEALETLARTLEQGPALSRVDGVTAQEFDTVPTWRDFQITH